MLRFGVALALVFASSTYVSSQETGSLFKNVMHNCFLTTNDNGEISCDKKASAGSRWEFSPEDDGKYSSFYNLKHKCTLAMGRNQTDSNQMSCYFDGSEQKAAFKFELKQQGKVFNVYNVRRKCGIYGNTTDVVSCHSLEASKDQQWAIVN